MKDYIVRSGTLLIVLPVLGHLYMLTKIGPSLVNIGYVVVGTLFTSISMSLGWKMIKSKMTN